MTDNPVAEIIARAIVDAMCKRGVGKHDVAHAIIAVLEEEGWKVLTREPTKKMSVAGERAVDDAIDGGNDSYTTYTILSPDVWAAVGYQAMWDAAPSWAGNEKAPPPE